MAKGLNKELIGKLTEGISSFSKAVDKMVEGTYSIKSFQSSITTLDTSLNKLKTLDEFNTNLKTNIENLSKINLTIDTSQLSKGITEPKSEITGGNTDALLGVVDQPKIPETQTNADYLNNFSVNIVKISKLTEDLIKPLQNLTNSLNSSVTQINNSQKDSAKVTKTSDGGASPPRDENRGTESGGEAPPPRSGGGLGFLGSNIVFTAIQTFTGAVGALRQQTEDTRRSLLGYGTDTQKFSNFLGTQLEGLRGGTLENLKNAASLYADGFRGNNRGLLQVASRLDLTNQSTEFLLKEFPVLAMSLRMSSDEMNSFAKKVDDAAVSYGVSTEKVVAGLSKIKILEDAANIGAYGKQFAENISFMNAKFAGIGPQIEKFVNSLFENEQQIVGLGGGDLLRKLEKAASPQEFENTIKDLASLMGKSGEMFASQAMAAGEGGRSMFKTIQEMKGVFGDVAFDGLKLRDAFSNFKNPIDATAAANKNYADSLLAAQKELANFFIPAMTMVIRAVTLVAGAFNSVIKYMGGFGAGLITFFSMVAVMIGIRYAILKAIGSLQSLAQASAQAAAATRARAAADAAGGASKGAAGLMGGLFGLAKGALGATPWGLALTVGVPLITTLLGSIGSSSDKTSKESERQREIQRNLLETQKAQQEKNKEKATSSYRDVYSMINSDLAFAVTNMRLDSMIALENSNKQINLLETIAKNGRPTGLPSRSK